MKGLHIILIAAVAASTPAFAENRDLSAAFRGQYETPVSDSIIDRDACREWYAGAVKARPDVAGLVVAKGRQSPVVYGTGFGRGPEAGSRHLTIGFTEAVPAGTVYLSAGKVSVSVLKEDAAYPGDPGNEEDWRPLSCLQLDKRPAKLARERGSSFWYGPDGIKTRAIRLTAKIGDGETPDESGNYQGWVAALYLFSDQLFNLSAYSVANASTNGRDAKNLTDGVLDVWDRWGDKSGSGASCTLSWPVPVKTRLVGLGQPMFTRAEILACTAKPSVHPNDAGDGDWKVVKTVDGMRTGYPCAMRAMWVDLGTEVTTRGLRVRPLAGPAIGGGYERSEHGHVEGYTRNGQLSGLSELIVLADRETLKTIRKETVVDDSKIGVPIDFEMPFDGLATLVIENEKGDRVRNLVSAGTFKAGKNRVYWDCSDDLTRDIDAAEHGLYHVPERPVAPGKYVVKGIAHRPLSGRYEMSVYSPGEPPWCLPDHTGAWLANHEPPRAACALPAGRAGDREVIALGANITEGPDGLITVDLDGNKTGGRRWIGGTWTAAGFLACDTGDGRIAKHDYYVGGLGQEGNTFELRLTAICGKGEERLARIPLGPNQGRAKGGIAVRDGVAVAALNCRNELWWKNLKSGEEGRIALDSPRGVAYGSDGTLYALSGTKLVTVSLADGKVADFAAGLDDPSSVTAVGRGLVAVSEQGASNRVKLFGADGRLVKTIGTAGPCRSGKYDPTHMNHPAEMAADSRGRLWVAEHDYLPKRISVWNLKSGKLERAFYGPPKYGAGGAMDPADPTRFHYTEGGGTLEFKLDYKTGESTVKRVLFRPDADGDALKAVGYPLVGEFAAMPQEVIYGPNGERLYSNSFNTDPVAGTTCAILCREENDRFVPAAYVVCDLQKDRVTIWSDRDSDGKRSGDESFECGARAVGVVFQKDLSLDFCFFDERPDDKGKAPRALRLKPVAYGPKGNPVYDFSKAETVFDGATWGPSSGGNQMLVDREGNAFTSNGVRPGPTHSLAGRTAKGGVWSIPNMWPGLHAGHSAPRDAVKGRLVAVTRMLGDFVYPKGTGESVLAINGNHGEIYFLTGDGYFIDNFLEDNTKGRLWNYPKAVRGMELAGTTPCDEHFWPTVNQTKDGTIRLVANKDSSSIIRLKGLETLTRFDAGAVNVTPATLAAVAKARDRLEAMRRQKAGTGRLALRLLKDAPKLDGDIGDWPEEAFVTIDSRGVAAYFDSNSKPYDIRGALAATKTCLYGAWKAQGAGRLAENAGGTDELLFKTGGALDVMLDIHGGIRLLVAEVGGRTKAMLYEKSVPGTPADRKVAFTSPVGHVTFDRVRDVSDKVKLVRGSTGDYEIEVPLDVIGFRPAAGTTLKGDIGALRGSGGTTIARLYWSNKATGIVSDVPSEAELKTQNWGVVEIK